MATRLRRIAFGFASILARLLVSVNPVHRFGTADHCANRLIFS